ncbi:DUF4177 domain-containing protein [Chloroflexota bacterium]
MLEYKVIEDTSMAGGNSPKAIEKKVNDMVRQGWRFAHVTSFATTAVSKVYLFFERESG